MEEQLESLLEILLEILPKSTGQLENIQATKKTAQDMHIEPQTLAKYHSNSLKL